ncbi:MAG: hypothetical protein FJ405_12450 [Verrucomicrobia bacterium]|nr:hypothetical protein [Verrucomicrobiota bacterium]
MSTPAPQNAEIQDPPVIRGWRRYLGIYAALWRNSVVREMGFKANFVLWIIVELLWFALQLCFFNVLYSHTDRIGDWTRWEVVALVGVSHLIQQLFQAFFLVNCSEISDQVQSGKLDFLLLLPVNTRFLLSLRKVDLGAFVNAATAACVIGFALLKLGHQPGLWQIIGFLILVLAGILIHYSLMFLLATISFWTVRAQGIVYGYYNLFNIARYPDSAYQGAFRRVFTFVLPLLLVSNVPAKVVTGRLQTGLDVLWLAVVGLGCAAISEWAWRFSVRRYTSASS